MTNPYTILGVDKTADDSAIKSAFRKLALKHHPDQNGQSEESKKKYSEIKEAYDKISDSQKRAEYDRFGDTPPEQRGFGGFGFNRGGVHSTSFKDGEFTFEYAHATSMEDILAQMAQARRAQAMRNRDITAAISITMEQAFNGCEVTLRAEGMKNELIIKIPAGVDNGSRIRVQGHGERHNANAPPGDLYVVTHIDPNSSRFGRSGTTIFSEETVDAIDLMLGLPIKVVTVSGKTVEVTVTGPVASGHKVSIPGEGMPKVNSPERGDHLFLINISVPESLSDKQKELLQEIKGLQNP